MYKRSKISFQDEWLQMEKYKSWISKVPRQPFKAKCKLCMKEFDVENMGKSSLDSHISGKKLKDSEDKRVNVYFHFDNSGTKAFSDSHSSNSILSPTLDSILESMSVAEIRWVINPFMYNVVKWRNIL